MRSGMTLFVQITVDGNAVVPVKSPVGSTISNTIVMSNKG